MMKRQLKIGIQIAAFLLFVAGGSFAQHIGGMLDQNQTWTGNNTDASGTTRTVNNLVVTGSCSGCNGAGVSVSPNSLVFANTRTGSSSAAQIVTVTANAVSVTVNSIALSIGTNFTYSAGAGCTTIAPAGSCLISVTFTPTVGGALTDTLLISTSAGNFSVPLSGVGVALPYPTASSIAVSPASPTIQVGSTQQMSATLTMSDSTTLAWTSLAWWAITGSSGGSGIPAVVNSCTPAYTGTSSLLCPASGSLSVTAGNVLVCVYVVNSTTQTYAFTDSLGTSFTIAGSLTSGSGATAGDIVGIYGTVPSTGSDVITAKETGSGSNTQIIACVQLANVSAYDTWHAANTSSSSTISSGNFTTTASGDIDFCGFADPATGGPFTVGSGYTLVSSSPQSAYAAAWEYDVLGSAGTYAGTMTNSASTSTSQGLCMAFTPNATSVASVSNPGGLVTATATGTVTISAAAAELDNVAFIPNVSGMTASAAFPGGQNGGDLNLILISWNQTSGSCTALASSNPVTDTAGNPYTAAGSVISGNGLCGVAYTANDIVLAPGNSNTVTVNWSASVIGAYVLPLEYAGLIGSSVVDVYGGTTGTGTTASKSITTTNATDLLVQLCYTNGTISAGSGKTAGGNSSNKAFYSVEFSAQTWTPNCNLGTGGTNWLILVITLKTPVGSQNATISASALPNKYYVDPINGSNSNSGTSSSPWLTLNYAIQHAAIGTYGAEIHAQVGTYTELYGACGNSAAAGICLTQGGTSTAVRLKVICDAPWSVPSASGCLIRPSGGVNTESGFDEANTVNNVDVQGFDISGQYLAWAIEADCYRPGASGTPPACPNGNSVHVINNYVHDLGQSTQFDLFSSGTPGCVENGAIDEGQHGYQQTDYQVLGNRVENVFQKIAGMNCGHGIYASGYSGSGGGPVIENNTIINPATSGIVVYDSPCHADVSNNDIVGAGGAGLQVTSGPNNACPHQGDNTIDNNLVWASYFSNFSATGGTSSDCSAGHTSLWSNNFSYQPGTGGTGSSDTNGMISCDTVTNLTTGINPRLTNVTVVGDTATEYGNYVPLTNSPLLGAGTAACAPGALITPCVPSIDAAGVTRPTPPAVGSYQ